MIGIALRTTTDPAGRPAVLIEFPDGWVTLSPPEAFTLAESITAMAAAIETEWWEQRRRERPPMT